MTEKGTGRGTTAAAFAVAASLALAQPARPDGGPDDPATAQAYGRAQLDALVAPLIQGSGSWRAANHEHVADDAESPAFWRLEHDWVFPRTLMRYRILGELKDGATKLFWEGTITWDPRLEVARVLQVHRAGIYGTGDLRRVDSETVRFALTFWRPGGGSQLFRDDVRSTGPGVLETRSQSYDAKEWKWVVDRVERWTLIKPEPAAAGRPSGE